VLQGIGGAMMVPVGRLVMLRTTPRTELVAAMAWLTTPALIGPVVGPPLGGLIVTYTSWRWIFDINVPIGVIGIIVVTLFIEDSREPPPGRFDTVGLILSGACLAGLMFGLETAGRGVIAPALTWAMVAVGVAAGVGYWVHSRTHAAPLLDLSLMRRPTFRVAISAMLLFRAGIGAIPFASSAGALIMKPVAQRALLWFGFRNTLIWNGVLSAGMLALCAGFRPAWPVVAIYAVLLVGGFFRSLQFTAMNTLAYSDVPRRKMSAATSLYTAGQQLAATVGISVGAVALEIAMGLSGSHRAQPWDFSVAFVVVSLFTLAAAPIALLMPANAGDDLAGRQPVAAVKAAARTAEAD
jgi:MFS family permease